MPFKSLDDALRPDPRFASLVVFEDGAVRPLALADHHSKIAAIGLSNAAPAVVRAAFDRARNTMLYAFFDYDLLVVGEVQAFGAFELALKQRLDSPNGLSRGTLRNLVDRARKAGILPALVPGASTMDDQIEPLIHLRNNLVHGTSDIHPPAMALDILSACGAWVDHLYPLSPGGGLRGVAGATAE
ncbi:MAG: hypothetical protein JSR91_08650 [Proteobacteria bacterium]|nr:hypothetical protein [Pseudomonadota bacterium]